jgi:hypothetical protein
MPPAPQPTDSVEDFNSKAFAQSAALAGFVTETNLVAGEVNANAVAAAASAVTAQGHADDAFASSQAAQTSAITAASSSGAALWVSGTTYALGDVVWSPATRYSYRRIVAGAGATDPSADPTNWALASVALPQLIVVTGTSASAQSGAEYALTNAAATTVTLPASPTVGDFVSIIVANGRVDNLVARNGKPINGVSEDMTITSRYAAFDMRYISAGYGWVIR